MIVYLFQYLTLATDVFVLLTNEIICDESQRLGQSALQLHDAHVALLSALAKDLDRETARTDTGKKLFTWIIPSSFKAEFTFATNASLLV